MRRFYKCCSKMAALGMAMILAFPVTGYAAETEKEEQETQETVIQQEEKPDLQDDFYEAVNYDMFQQWEIPADKAAQNWFYIVQEQNDERLLQMVKEASEDEDAEVGSDSYNVGAFYLTGMDTEARDQGGYGEAGNAFLEKVDQAQSVEELVKACLTFYREYGIASLLGFTYGVDGEDSSQNVLYLVGGDTGLSKEIWFSDDAANQKQVELFQTYMQELLKINGLSEDEASSTVKEVADMMKALAENSLGLADLYDPQKTYNVYKASDVEELFGESVSSETLEEIFGISPDEKMIISDVGCMEKVASFLKDENLELLKKYVKVSLYRDLSPYVDTKSHEAQQTYVNSVNGLEEGEPYEQQICSSVQSNLGFQCGKLFSEKYFQEDTRSQIQSMIDQVAEVFENRLENMEWMSPETRAQAIEKLQTLDARIGCPDEWPQEDYELQLKRPEEGGVYVDNLMEIAHVQMEQVFQTKDEPVDKSEWLVYPQEVNAYYDTSTNSITILAGILQEPFYDPDAEPEENLGKIGAVIGHEITHAFDSAGAQYDAEGNIRNWWTDEDLEYFQELSQKVIDYYDGMEIAGLEVNGEQTVTENIADLGGLSCVLEIAEQNGYDLKTVMESWASLWAEELRPEALSNQIATDVHSPGKIRVNAVLSAMDQFYDVYGIEEGDGMYYAPEERPEIW